MMRPGWFITTSSTLTLSASEMITNCLLCTNDLCFFLWVFLPFKLGSPLLSSWSNSDKITLPEGFQPQIIICSSRSSSSIALILISLNILRSEEHTSELQSRPHLVCRLLLEKKKHMRNTPILLRIRQRSLGHLRPSLHRRDRVTQC